MAPSVDGGISKYTNPNNIVYNIIAYEDYCTGGFGDAYVPRSKVLIFSRYFE